MAGFDFWLLCVLVLLVVCGLIVLLPLMPLASWVVGLSLLLDCRWFCFSFRRGGCVCVGFICGMQCLVGLFVVFWCCVWVWLLVFWWWFSCLFVSCVLCLCFGFLFALLDCYVNSVVLRFMFAFLCWFDVLV